MQTINAMNNISDIHDLKVTPISQSMRAAEQITMALPWMEVSSINPLITAAMPLLLLLIQIKNLARCDDPLALRNQAMREINQFEEQAKHTDCTPRTILAARYCLCTALDEFALSTEWGANGIWAQQSLLSLVHKETWGGERFFIILEKMADEEKHNVDFLELLYLLLSLGYEGKYYNQDRMVREEIRHRLFRLIQTRRTFLQESLSPSHEALTLAMPKPPHPLITWLIPLTTAGILLLGWLGFNYGTARYAEPILNTLQTLDNQAISKQRTSSLAPYLGIRTPITDKEEINSELNTDLKTNSNKDFKKDLKKNFKMEKQSK